MLVWTIEKNQVLGKYKIGNCKQIYLGLEGKERERY